MVMKKFHNSFSTGLFLGAVVALAQFFFLSFLIYYGYVIERQSKNQNAFEDGLQACICLIQSILLGSFALMLGAHRSEILSRSQSLHDVNTKEESSRKNDGEYNPPVALS